MRFFISVVIPVRNEAAHIEYVLDRLLEQKYPPERFEILVIDGRSDDDTRRRVDRYVESRKDRAPHVYLYDNPKRVSAAARNIGIDRMNGDVYLLVDGHCLIENDRMLEAVDAAFHVEGVDCVGRPQPLEMKNANFVQHAIAAARRSPLGHHPDSFIYSNETRIVPAASVAVAYRKEVFEKVGRFDECFDAAEDYEFNHRCDRAGLRCLFAPETAVHYVPRRSLTGLFRQLVRYGRGRVRLLKKHPDTFSFKSLLPAFFVSCLVIVPFAEFLYPELFCVLSTVLGVYLVLVAFESARIAIMQKNPLLYSFLPLVFLVIHIASGIGSLLEMPRWKI